MTFKSVMPENAGISVWQGRFLLNWRFRRCSRNDFLMVISVLSNTRPEPLSSFGMQRVEGFNSVRSHKGTARYDFARVSINKE